MTSAAATARVEPPSLPPMILRWQFGAGQGWTFQSREGVFCAHQFVCSGDCRCLRNRSKHDDIHACFVV